MPSKTLLEALLSMPALDSHSTSTGIRPLVGHVEPCVLYDVYWEYKA